MKLIDCDKSDMNMWAKSIPAKNFLAEIKSLRDKELRIVINTLDHKAAGRYEAFDKVIDIITSL